MGGKAQECKVTRSQNRATSHGRVLGQRNAYPNNYQGNSTSTFQSSMAPGQIISMWSSSDHVGHVAVVIAVNVTDGNGTITIIGENGNANGTGTITVSSSQMSYGGIYNDFQWTTNMPS